LLEIQQCEDMESQKPNSFQLANDQFALELKEVEQELAKLHARYQNLEDRPYERQKRRSAEWHDAICRLDVQLLSNVEFQDINCEWGSSGECLPLGLVITVCQSPDVNSDVQATMIEVLYGKGANVNAVCLRRWWRGGIWWDEHTPLAMAVCNENVTLIRLLREYGADRDVACRHGGQMLTPVLIAEKLKKKKCLRALKQRVRPFREGRVEHRKDLQLREDSDNKSDLVLLKQVKYEIEEVKQKQAELQKLQAEQQQHHQKLLDRQLLERVSVRQLCVRRVLQREEQERLEKQQRDQERLEQQQREQERLEQQRREQERLAQQREQERLEQQQREQERREQERLAQQREEERLEQQRQRREREQLEKEG